MKTIEKMILDNWKIVEKDETLISNQLPTA